MLNPYLFLQLCIIPIRATRVAVTGDVPSSSDTGKNQLSILNFCIKNHDSCADLQTEFDDVALILRDYKVSVDTIDCGQTPDFCRSHSIFSYPAIRFYSSDGTMTRYRGPRTANGITSRAIRELNPIVWPIADGYLEDIKSFNKSSLLLYMNTDDEDSWTHVMNVAELLREDVVTGVVQGLPNQHDGLDFLEVQHPDDELSHSLSGPIAMDDLLAFTRRMSARPLIGRFSPETYDDYYKAGVPLLYICADTSRERKTIAELMRSLALTYHDKIRFTTLDTTRFGYHAHGMGVDLTKLPGIVIRDLANKQNFHMDREKEITTDRVREFLISLE